MRNETQHHPNQAFYIEKRDGSGTLLRSYTYDQKNRIASVATASGTYYFDYDPNDYRISKMDSACTRVYLLEGEHLEAVYDGDAQILAKYLRGVVVDEIVNGYYYDDQGKKTNYTFHHDHLRSVVGLTDHQGTTVETTKYGPFGEEIASTGTTDNFLKYTAREHDEDTGLYYYRARYYDPEIGRFLTEDPWGFDAGVNFYTSVSNNPINANDPYGHLADILLDAGFIAYDIYSLVKNPGWDTAAALGLDVVGAAVPFVTGLGAGYRAGSGAIDAARTIDRINNPIPETLTRVVPDYIPAKNLESLGRSTPDVFVTDANVIASLNSSQLTNKLTIPDSSVSTLIEFPTNSINNIASPINRTNPGFVGEGLQWVVLQNL